MNFSWKIEYMRNQTNPLLFDSLHPNAIICQTKIFIVISRTKAGLNEKTPFYHLSNWEI